MPIVSILDDLEVIKTVTKKVEGIQNKNLQLIQKDMAKESPKFQHL